MFGDVLIVDNETDICDLIAGVLEDEAYEVRVASDSDSALREITRRCPAIVLLDIKLQGSRLDGLEILNILRERYVHLPVVIISGHDYADMATNAVQNGAYDFIEKPLTTDKLLVTVARAIEAARLQRENAELKRRAFIQHTLIGKAPAMDQLQIKIDKLAQGKSRVMIVGPLGAGKEAAAHQLHNRSSRASHNLISIHAAMLAGKASQPDRLLFGSEGDGQIEPGLIEQAHGGTLYLDEICGFSQAHQKALLKMLVDGEITRLGGKHPVPVDVRVLSSCSGDIDKRIADGQLRKDLYHRLSVMTLDVPGLSKRRDDIPYLVSYFIGALSEQMNMPKREAGEDVMAVMQSHDWPGNVRQLRNTVEHMLLNCHADGSDALTLEHLPSDILSKTNVGDNVQGSRHIMSLPLREARECFERDYLVAQIDRFSGNISRTAEFVGMERSALHRKMKSLGISGGNHATNSL
ncbi:MAG: sigma-54-dependent transcriptional regulator [Parvibaculales bacterium]